ncbi:uncharacterized protein KY384_007711 [Bacidia gigantensis]|uniref:uncharacterized protein n=1 Tax=Bacidia gigantensis TaxID=2732470 RepID=UPI001D039113|nr:uncharacterized protein KY384_007711 [Bacidia gigantensis]KAG8527559.1 hypothetical protein KY384_007711 [Bacidia gigantensis]
MHTPSDNTPQLHIVIAHSREGPRTMNTWLSQLRTMPNIWKLGTKTTVYTKSKLDETNKFMSISKCDELHHLRNRGREGGTFLHHIVKNYDNLARFTMFIHEHPVGLNEATGLFDEAHYDALRYQLKNSTGFINHGLNEPGIGWCNCGDCEGPETHQFPLVPQIMALYTDKVCQGKQRVAMYNQFVVSRDRIQARPKRIYEYLLELVVAPKHHWIHGEKEPWQVLGWMDGSSPEHPLFLYTLERLWSGLFGCDEDPWAEGCVMFSDKDQPAKAITPSVGEPESDTDGIAEI